ncbi:hypothetical protein BDW62DRAFT_179196 [Aspergillus aurantiobrunneus]
MLGINAVVVGWRRYHSVEHNPAAVQGSDFLFVRNQPAMERPSGAATHSIKEIIICSKINRNNDA